MEPHPNSTRAIFIGGILVVVLAGLAVWFARANQQVATSSATPTPTVSAAATATATPRVVFAFKTVDYLGPFSAEVPFNWSVYQAGDESAPSTAKISEMTGNPIAAIGQKDVRFGDTNWSQVDFFYFSGDRTQEIADLKKSNDYAKCTWTTRKILDKTATVCTWPLDNGEVTKGGTGGTDIYIVLPKPYFGDSVSTLLMRKQAKGDADFEAGFEHFLTSMNEK